MVLLVVLLAVTNVVTLAALGYVWLRPPDQPRPDGAVRAAIDRAPGPSGSALRQVISVEVLNAVELARARGRLAGFAGTLAPGLVKRIVHDQTIKTMRRQLAAEGVVADVRLHAVAPIPPG